MIETDDSINLPVDERKLTVDTEKRERLWAIAEEVRGILDLRSPASVDSLVEAIRRMGGRVESVPGIEIEASIRPEADGRFVVVLNRNKPTRRQVFSLAHEIGHLFLHLNFADKRQWNRATPYVESYERSRYGEEEYEANQFAAALLMPKAAFVSAYGEGHPDWSAIGERFGVSAESAATRARWLGLSAW